jgi:hypothetical protein
VVGTCTGGPVHGTNVALLKRQDVEVEVRIGHRLVAKGEQAAMELNPRQRPTMM